MCFQVDPAIEDIRRWLRERSRRVLDHVQDRAAGVGPEEIRHAAVLLTLRLQENSDPELLFVVRSSRLRHHPGQIAFPGGRVDEEDESHRHAALREAEEEVGIRPEQVLELGLLDDQYTSVSRFVVTPMLGLLDPEAEVRIASEENEAFFWISLYELQEGCRPVRLRAPGEPWKREGQWIFPTPHGGLWGLSSRITRNFLNQDGLLEAIRSLPLCSLPFSRHRQPGVPPGR